jgi:exodeoxyribonuclease VII small subunit
MTTADKPDRDLSYEQARRALDEVVARLEAGGVTLEESLQLWERGEALADICQAWLDGARARFAAVVEAAASPPGTGPPG